MGKHFTETLVVAGPHIRDLFDDISTQLEKTPPGEVEIRRSSSRKLIIRSFNPFTAILSYLYDNLRKRYPDYEFALTSGREGEAGRIAGYCNGASVFETHFDFTSKTLPRAAARHSKWLHGMFRS